MIQTKNRLTSALLMLAAACLVVGFLRWGRPVLMPLALAILLTFLLNPLVNGLQRWRVHRPIAVGLVVIFVFSLLAGITVALGWQISALANGLPAYKDNIRKKLVSFRSAGKGSSVERVQQTLREIAGEMKAEEKRAATNEAAFGPPRSAAAEAQEKAEKEEEKPVPVIVQGGNTMSVFFPSALGPLLGMVGMLGLVVVFVIFMLLRIQDLRNRIIRLSGYTRLTTTTKAIDEAGARISRYLLTQSLLNATYGLALGIGLYFIGLPYVTLWAFLAAIARFIPYVGPWLGALLPFALSLAVFDGWLTPLAIIGFIVVLELVSNMILEPLLYGQSAGVNEVALVGAMAFWTWVWGPIGLALATPLTVCVVVLCKYIPEFEFIQILMSDNQVMERRLIYYQRLLAADEREALNILHVEGKNSPPEALADNLLIPSLTFLKLDFEAGKLTEADRDFILAFTRNAIAKLLDGSLGSHPAERHVQPDASHGMQIIGRPAEDEVDGVAVEILHALLCLHGYEMEIVSSETLSSEILNVVQERNPAIVCIGSIPPSDISSARYLCKRLKDRFPHLKLVIGYWGIEEEASRRREEIHGISADFYSTSLKEASNQIAQLAHLVLPASELGEPAAAPPA